MRKNKPVTEGKIEKILTAFATDDGEIFIDRHFGDAESYRIYDISPQGASFVLKVENPTLSGEEQHADPEKARGVSGVLRDHGVHAAVSRFFGPNIERVRRQFVCVIVRVKTVEEGIAQVQAHFGRVLEEWEKGPERSPVDLTDKAPEK